jgi:hypothetical protein
MTEEKKPMWCRIGFHAGRWLPAPRGKTRWNSKVRNWEHLPQETRSCERCGKVQHRFKEIPEC